ncbi:hypothetical protein [Pseudonocardia sp.]|uniref:hypothetical protein n=1 Tax=Pseudonocardia sp. TaxID=60912 RepID=UPI003D0A8B63
MTAPTDQFVDITKRSQEVVTAAVRTWTDAFQSLAGSYGAPAAPDAKAIVEGYFDFAQQVLDNQRAFTLSVVSAGSEAAEKVTAQATKVAENVKEHTLHAAEVVTEKATTTATRNAKAAAKS